MSKIKASTDTAKDGAAMFIKCARASLHRKNTGEYPELKDDTFSKFNDMFGWDTAFWEQTPADIAMALCFMAAMVEAGDA